MRGDSPLREATFCSFDVETTGLSSFSRLVEIGAVRFHIGGKGEEFSTLVDPCQHISENVTLVHGIDDAAVIGAPTAREAIEGFLTFTSDCVLVAHNASFDVGIMAIEAGRAGLRMPPATVLDSIGLAKSFLPKQPNYQLSTLAKTLGVDTSKLHRALADAQATKAVVEAAILSLPGWMGLPLEYLASKTRMIDFADYVVMGVELPPHFGLLSQALKSEIAIRIVYDGGSKGRSPRTITPSGLFARKGYVYVEALCHADGVSKSFRLDRILEVRVDAPPE